MLNSRFSHSNPAHMTKENFRQGQLARFANDPEALAYKRGYMDYTNLLFEDFIDMVDRLTDAVPERDFVLRPHPSEAPDLWERMAARKRNLTVNSQNTATAWSLESDVTIHNGCMTAIEASLLGCNVVAYMPRQSSSFDVKWPNAVSHKITDMDPLIDYVRTAKRPDATRRSELATQARKTLSGYFAGMKGEKSSSELVLDALDKDVFTRKRSAGDHCFEFRHKVMRYLSKTRRGLGLNPRGVAADRAKDAYFELKFPSLDISEVDEALHIAGGERFQLRQIRKNWFSVTR